MLIPRALTLVKNLQMGLGHMLYPQLCSACSSPLKQHEAELCLSCVLTLPRTNVHLGSWNPLEQHFSGKVELSQATAWLFFSKDSRVQQLVHNIKYHYGWRTAETAGRIYGGELARSEHWQRPDVVIPVPLHDKRYHKRGYNQSEAFGRGLAEALGIPLSTRELTRTRNTKTQTRKNAEERQRNVEGAFTVNHPETLRGKHVLLVDDVVTTGATMAACAQSLSALISPVKISVAALAVAV